MTTTLARAAAVRDTSNRPSTTNYGDVPDMIRRLAALPADSSERLRMRELVVRRCLPLAEHIARRYDGRGEPRDDLLQTARVGLLNAIDRFNPDSGNDFLSFAVPTIMGEVKRYFRDNGWAVHVPRRLKESRAQITTATAELSQRMGRAPTPTELAGALGMDRQDVVETLIAAQCYQTKSLDAPVGGDGDDSPSVVDRLGNHDTCINAVDNREALRPLLAQLPEREREILTMRFYGYKTQSQIAQRLGISQMHVSRLLARSLAQLRAGMTA